MQRKIRALVEKHWLKSKNKNRGVYTGEQQMSFDKQSQQQHLKTALSQALLNIRLL